MGNGDLHNIGDPLMSDAADALVSHKNTDNSLNSSLPGQNGRYFTDDIFKRIFINENIRISIRISLKFVPKGLIDLKAALVQVMAWQRTGNKPLPEPMLTQFTEAYMRH